MSRMLEQREPPGHKFEVHTLDVRTQTNVAACQLEIEALHQKIQRVHQSTESINVRSERIAQLLDAQKEINAQLQAEQNKLTAELKVSIICYSQH